MGQKLTIFNIGRECKVKDTPLNCSLSWAATDIGANLTRIGGIEHGHFEANGDLAGLGVSFGFVQIDYHGYIAEHCRHSYLSQSRQE